MMELRLSRPLDGLADNLTDLIAVVECGETWLRYSAPNPTELNPRLLNRLAEAKIPVLTLSEVPRSIEAVYLRAVEEDER